MLKARMTKYGGDCDRVHNVQVGWTATGLSALKRAEARAPMKVQGMNDEWKVPGCWFGCESLVVSNGRGRSDGQVARRHRQVACATRWERGVAGVCRDMPLSAGYDCCPGGKRSRFAGWVGFALYKVIGTKVNAAVSTAIQALVI